MTRCLTPGCSRLIPSGSYCREHRPYGKQWERVIVPQALARDGHQCVQCGRPCPHPRHHHVDHIKPKGQGGEDSLSNARTLCARANTGKGVCAP